VTDNLASPPILPDNTPVDLQAIYQDSHIQEVLEQLDRELVGLKPVKTRIREVAALLLVDRLRKEMHLTADSPSYVLHR
jgi:hypothetical protein